MPFVATGASEVHYEIDGHGPGLTLVHGTGGDADKVFGHVVDHFAGHRTVVRPNLGGSGKTSDDGGPLTVELIAEQVTAAIRTATDGPVDLLGFSLGAAAAVGVAAEHPELVRKLILVAGWAHTTGPRDHFYFQTWRNLLDVDREMFKRFSTLTGFGPAAVDRFGHAGLAASLADDWPPAGIARQLDLGLALDLRPLLPRIQAPTLVIGLGRDNMVPIESSRDLHAAIANSRLVEIADEGHMDWFADPTAVLRAVDEFLDR
ncbi:alpha/beta fold hydrolase [Nocardia arthritidis]|nr:alpha/beta hydrolase [Nocardia arthritidis]